MATFKIKKKLSACCGSFTQTLNIYYFIVLICLNIQCKKQIYNNTCKCKTILNKKKRIYKEMIKNIYTKLKRQIWGGGGGRKNSSCFATM